jgi:hypothetical protein
MGYLGSTAIMRAVREGNGTHLDENMLLGTKQRLQ